MVTEPDFWILYYCNIYDYAANSCC